MNDKKITLFVLVSMFLSVVELTVDPTFYLGRIFLGLSICSLIVYSVSFVMQNWRYKSPK